MTARVSKLSVPAEAAYLELVGQFVVFIASRIGFDGRDAARIRLAVDEACANVVMHTDTREKVGSFAVLCEEDADQLTIRIQDAGEAFDPDEVAAPDLDGPIENRKVGGLGIFLMRRVMDHVECHALAEGKEMVLIKRRVAAEEAGDGH